MVLQSTLVAYEAVAQDLTSPVDSDAFTDDDNGQHADSALTLVVESLRRRSSVRTPQIPKDVELAIVSDTNENEKSKNNKEDQEDNDDIYNISTGDDTLEQPIDPFSKDYVGLSSSYFSVGILVGASLSLLYPVLIVRGGAPASLMAASSAIIMLFWSYKIFFGFLSDWLVAHMIANVFDACLYI